MKNALGRQLPDQLPGYEIRPYETAYGGQPAGIPVHSRRCSGKTHSDTQKLSHSMEDTIRQVGLCDGMTISFHHSLREGDKIVGLVLSAISKLGIKNLKFAPSAVVNIKNPSIVDFIHDGTITSIEASGIRGGLGDGVLEGLLDSPVILRPHGSRPRAIEAGQLAIDVAFIGASAADHYGNATGQIGPNCCGALGYSMIDATTAGRVVVVTDHLVDYP